MHSALLTYDAVDFVKYLDTAATANAPPPGSNSHNYSPWLFLDAAHVLFQTAKSRAYEGKLDASSSMAFSAALKPVLEPLPKWHVLAEILQEIEHDAYLHPANVDESNGTILIMCNELKTARQLREYIGTMHTKIGQRLPTDNEDEDESMKYGSSADIMMRRHLRNYLDWKKSLSNVNRNLSQTVEESTNSTGTPGAQRQQGRPPPNKRRRVRGGGAVNSAAARVPNSSVQTEVEQPIEVINLLNEIQPTEVEKEQKLEIDIDDLEDMEDYYELYEMNDLVVVHPYDGDMDEQLLEELRPRYIIMYEPDSAFIRRVEVYRSSHSGRNVKVYFMYYGGSVEEQRYLSAVRREKDSFTKLIKEKGVSHIFILWHRQIVSDIFFLEHGCDLDP